MKKVVLILIVILIVAGSVYGFYYVTKRKEKVAEEKEVFKGMTGKEFVKQFLPVWKAKYFDAMYAYLRDVEAKRFSTHYDGVIDGKSLTDRKAELEAYVKKETQRAWDEGVNPLDFEWSRKYWLPSTIDDMGLNYNDEIVQEYIKQI